MLLNFSLTAATRSDIFWTRIGGGLVVVLCGLLLSTDTQAQTDGVLAKLKRNEKLLLRLGADRGPAGARDRRAVRDRPSRAAGRRAARREGRGP